MQRPHYIWDGCSAVPPLHPSGTVSTLIKSVIRARQIMCHISDAHWPDKVLQGFCSVPAAPKDIHRLILHRLLIRLRPSLRPLLWGNRASSPRSPPTTAPLLSFLPQSPSTCWPLPLGQLILRGTAVGPSGVHVPLRHRLLRLISSNKLPVICTAAFLFWRDVHLSSTALVGLLSNAALGLLLRLRRRRLHVRVLQPSTTVLPVTLLRTCIAWSRQRHLAAMSHRRGRECFPMGPRGTLMLVPVQCSGATCPWL